MTAPQNSRNAVRLEGVSFAYEGFDRPVLDGVDFTLAYGEITLLAGLSGEGKSTLLSIINGSIPNVCPGTLSGAYTLNGQNAAGFSMSRIAREVGSVLQNADAQIVYPTVEDELAFGCENMAMPVSEIEHKIDAACRMMRLDKAGRTRTLSGGQKQRLITASTLAMGQRILLLDEPLANLDKPGTALLLSTLRALAGEGCAVLLVEHRLDAVMPFADAVWEIRDKKLCRIGDKAAYLRGQAGLIRDEWDAVSCGDCLLRLDNVSYGVKNRNILTDITLDIRRGERVLLLGENGSGKTTLLRLLAKLIKPTAGEYRQNVLPGFKRKKGNAAWFKRVGVVYQNPNYQLFMPTVGQEVMFGAADPAYAEKILRLFGIERLRDRHPQSLSEGQKRRVTIAAVAAARPEVLILDEPTVGQDYAGLKTVVSVLNRLHQESGNTMLTVTHDFRCADALCDRVLLLDGSGCRSQPKPSAREFFAIDR